MTTLCEAPEATPTFGHWVCSCKACLIAVTASIPLGTRYVLKCSMGRDVISARTLARHMASGTLDAQCERDGLGYIREVFVADDRP
jgi:hypothetical protein